MVVDDDDVGDVAEESVPPWNRKQKKFRKFKSQ